MPSAGRPASPGRVLRAARDLVWYHAMPAVAVAAALVTCFAVPPDAAYLTYVDLRTLGRLACVLAVVGALGRTGAFQVLAARLAGRCKTARALAGALVGVTALASMLVTNDMALVALLPLSAAALEGCGRRDLVAPVFVLQGVAANLCGMLLPFGNPQNIYLSSWYSVGFSAFVGTMAVPFALSVALVALGCVALVDARPVEVCADPPKTDRATVAVLTVLLLVCAAAVLGAVPVALAAAAVLVGLLAVDRGALAHTDWGLVVTFAAFFVFAGNVARMPALAHALQGWMTGGAFVPAALLSQVVSNVPAAVVLSRFTGDWRGLLVGVNAGGAGTPVASLATLIVVAHFGVAARGLRLGRRRFWVLLLGANAVCLGVLLVVGVLAGW